MARSARLIACLGGLGAVLCLVGGPALGSELPTGFRDTTVGSNLEEPTTIRFSPDGRIFIALKGGEILVFDGLEALENGEATVFADLRTFVNDPSDRGLLGLVLDPGFPARPYVYVLYTYDHILGGEGEDAKVPRWGNPNQLGDPCPKPPAADVDACPVSGRLVRLTASEGGKGDTAVESNGEVVQQALVEDWCQQFSSHSIGDLQFDSGGNLYASGGDGASFLEPDYGQFGWPETNQCGDPNAPIGSEPQPPGAEGGALRVQDVRTPGDPTGLDGSIIRIDPETGEGVAGNPMFASADPNARRIVAYGFRNPFRFAIDPSSGEVYVGNVGWNTYEEIDRFAPNASPAFDSGWPCYEGPGPNPEYQALGLSLCQALYTSGDADAPPFFYYRHHQHVIPEDGCDTESGSAVSGMALYEGGPFPSAYDGALFFADPVLSCIYVMFRGDDGRPDPLTTTTFMSQGGLYPGVDLEVGPDGSLYYVKLFGDSEPGTIHRISYDPDAPVAHLEATPQWGKAPLASVLDASGSTDPNKEALSYEWDLDGNGSFETDTGATAILEHTFSGTENVTVAVKAHNGKGRSSVAHLTLFPGDTPPDPVIEAPSASLTWGVGQQIDFEGTADDGEEGMLEDDDLYWKTRLYHCPSACHAHPLQVFPGVGSGSFDAPDHDYPSHIEISFTATDSRGLSATRSVSIDPRTVDLTIGSDPPGVTLGAGPLMEASPFTLRAIEGSHVGLAAPPTALLDGREYSWTGWSDGRARLHTIVADESAAYTASYAIPGQSSALPSRPRPGIHTRPARRTHERSAVFSFSSHQPEATFRCRLDRRAPAACASPQGYRGLGPGPHVFRVLAVGDGSDWADSAAAVFHWRILCGDRHRHPHARPHQVSGTGGAVSTRRPSACARRVGPAGRAG